MRPECGSSYWRKAGEEASGAVVSGWRFVWKEYKTVILASVAVVSAVKIYREVKKRKLRKKWDSVGENVVVLHGFSRSKTCPNLSPFVLKLETYLRMADIKYEYDYEQPFGPKGKSPWITLNGEDFADSQLIMEFLGNKFNKNFSSTFTQEQKAIARAMLIMTDEHIFWGLVWWRICKDPDSRIIDLMELPYLVFIFLRRKMRHRLMAQGTGLHSNVVIEDMIQKDIQALSVYLGEKPFLMGNTPCEVDCAVFGMMAQFVWGTPGSPFSAMVQSDYRNILNYCIRMKEKFWPDWNTHLLQ